MAKEIAALWTPWSILYYLVPNQLLLLAVWILLKLETP